MASTIRADECSDIERRRKSLSNLVGSPKSESDFGGSGSERSDFAPRSESDYLALGRLTGAGPAVWRWAG
jgi:hypothetical protein